MRPSSRALIAVGAFLALVAPEIASAQTDPLTDPANRRVREAFAIERMSLFDKPQGRARCADSAIPGLAWCASGMTYETSEDGAYSRTFGYNLDAAGRIVYIILTRKEFPLAREKFDETLKALGARYGKAPTTLTFTGKTAEGDEVYSLVAYWGDIKLVRLAPAELRTVAQAGTLNRGPLVDHRQDLRASARQGDPVYKVEGKAGFIAEFRSVTDVRTDYVLRAVYQPGFTPDPAGKPDAAKPDAAKPAAALKFRELPLDPGFAEPLRKIREEQERLAAIERARREEEERKVAAERARREEEARKIAAARRAEEEARRAEEERLAAIERARREEEERKAAEIRRAAEAKAAEERRIADAKAAEEKRLADAKVAEQRRLADAKAAEERRIAEERGRREAAERMAAEERKRREESERQAAEAKRLAEERARREEAERKAAEAKRIAEERARLEEAERRAAAERRALEERARKAEADYRASLERAQRAEAERRAAEERARQAEAERRAAEERARRIEIERKAAEARRAAEEKRRAEERMLLREQAERRAAEERRLAEERRAADERRAAEERRLVAERVAEARRAEAERRAAEERREAELRRSEAERKAAAERPSEPKPPAIAAPPRETARVPKPEPETSKPAASDPPAAPPQFAGPVPGTGPVPGVGGPAASREEWLRMAIAQSRNSSANWVFERVRDRISDDVVLRARGTFATPGSPTRFALEIAFECNADAGKRLAAHVRAYDPRTNAALRIPPEDGRAGVVRGSVALDEEPPQAAFLFPERDERQASIIELPLVHDDVRKNTPRAQAWLRHFRVTLKFRVEQGEASATIHPYAENLRRVLEACSP